MEEKRRPRIVIADDDAALRYAMRRILKQDCDVVGEAIDGQASVELAGQLRPDAILLDISMPVLGGIGVVGRLKEAVPGIRIIIVSNYTDSIYVDEALNSGASGYVIKGSALFRLPTIIEEVLNGCIVRPT